PGGNVDVIRQAWISLKTELTTAEQGLMEAEFLNRAQRRLNEAIERQRRYDRRILSRANTLATTTVASSRESLVAMQRQAKIDASAAEKNRLRAEHDREQAQ